MPGIVLGALDLRYTKCGARTSNIFFAWESSENAITQAPLQNPESESAFEQDPDVTHMHILA